jgi:hypothetical protein|nr:MAG TPA: hypothetical protein [Caudoviricetes sp.]
MGDEIKEFLKEPSDILSLISLVLSVGFSIYTFMVTSKLNKVNLKADIFNSIFFKLLFEKYSTLFTNINTWDSSDFDNIDNFIIECKQKLDTYKFINKKFYKKAKDELSVLDDYIVKLDYSNLSKNNFKKVEEFIESIYQLFLHEYLN